MTRLMRDSSTLTDIPVPGTQIVMAYPDGLYAEAGSAVAARFPGIPVCWMDVLGTDHAADGLDVENGAATVVTAVVWTKGKLVLKPAYPPLIYCNRSTLTPLFNAMNSGGLKVVRDFRLGIATLDGTTTVPDMTGVTFVQHRGEAQTGGHWDESIVYDNSWKVPPAPPWQVAAFTLASEIGQDVSELAAMLRAHGG